ncbi:FecR family protein [Sinimarinibacterium sp. CAU 1509]|uniref:FecR family protein n=1 Tax=Sinimarinibacterium sp. CAU 1509 TaxID=2562283 RepID=UPI001B7FC12C|nr:hypothetical protein [Sinimarinibacterium sp. CAU 1509]
MSAARWFGDLGRSALLIGLLLTSGVATAATQAGEVLLVTGSATATSPQGSVRELAKGDALYSGEILNSGPNSYLNVRFTDGGFTLLRPNTRFVIEDYAFQADPSVIEAAQAAAHTQPTPTPKPAVTPTPAPRPSVAIAPTPAPQQSTVARSFFRLVKGGFRSITGLVGKINRDEYKVATPVATIGIRGTDITVIDCDLVCAEDPVIQEALHSLPPGTTALGATILIVNSGEAYITNALTGETTIASAGMIVLSLPNGIQIVLGEMPGFLLIDPPPPPDQCLS